MQTTKLNLVSQVKTKLSKIIALITSLIHSLQFTLWNKLMPIGFFIIKSRRQLLSPNNTEIHTHISNYKLYFYLYIFLHPLLLSFSLSENSLSLSLYRSRTPFLHEQVFKARGVRQKRSWFFRYVISISQKNFRYEL